tara:strand:+ start:128 stop:472 length:345 start_codon:yes stop_codon:yes gene_type:complete
MNVWLAIWAILDFASVNHEPPPENTEVVEIVCEYFDPCVRPLGIAWCESLHNPNAYAAAEKSSGLFQINEHYWGEVFAGRWRLRFDPEQSTRFAAHIVENTKAKWNLWTCGRYK